MWSSGSAGIDCSTAPSALPPALLPAAPMLLCPRPQTEADRAAPGRQHTKAARSPLELDLLQSTLLLSAMALLRCLIVLVSLSAILERVEGDGRWSRRVDPCVKSDPPVAIGGQCQGSQASHLRVLHAKSSDFWWLPVALLVVSICLEASFFLRQCLPPQMSSCVCTVDGHQVDSSSCSPMTLYEQLVRES